MQAIRSRLANRPDTEHEQALVRLAVGSVFFLYLMPKALKEPEGFGGINHQFLAVMVLFIVVSLLIFASVLMQRNVSVVRRIFGACLDSSAVSYFMCEMDINGAPLFLAYIWATLGNGFRYGPSYLISSLAFNVAGFSLVLWLSPFWSQYTIAGIGMMIGMTALSLYVLSLVKRMFDALHYAEAANLAKRRFISVVSHEMRTPLNAIIGMGDLLRETHLNREQKDMIQTMSVSSRLLLSLVEDVLDFSKIESGKLNVEHTEFDLHALINSTCRIIQPQAEAKGLDLQVSMMPEVSPSLRGDPHHLRQVLINLVGNAVKFTERGGVTVHVSLIGETENAARVKFSVRDSGIGIPQDAQDRIFDSFVQADQSTTRRFGGTGLGTTIAKQLVELMGGRMGLESAVGLGSTFWFELELQKQPSPDKDLTAADELFDATIMVVGFPASSDTSLVAALRFRGLVPIPLASIEDAVRWLLENTVANPVHSMLIYASTAAGAQRASALLQRHHLPMILVFDPLFWDDVDAIVPFSYSAKLSLPVQERLLFNALHSLSAFEYQEKSSSVVQLRDYFKLGARDRQFRIMVADDSTTNRQVIGKILERGGHTVTLVEDGEDALDALESSRFDLVILDRNMPGMGGVETLRAIRLMNLGQGRLPVIILSADVTSETREDCIDAGADCFLSKPVEAIRLLNTVADLCVGKAPAISVTSGRHKKVGDNSPATCLNLETLQLLEGLGTQNGFMERLVGVFINDNCQLLQAMERSVANRDFTEFRRLLHAMKGSAASMGAERLASLCTETNSRSDTEMRLQSTLLMESVQREFTVVRTALERFIESRRRTTG